MYADENVIKIKHEVIYEVAKLAFAGELEEKRDHIPMKMIPGPLPQFRCCIYKERELAYKLQLEGYDIDKNVITRIETNKRYVTDLEIKAFAQVFQVTYEFLLDGKER